MFLGQAFAALFDREQQAIEGLIALQGAQVLGVGTGNVDRDVVGVREDAFQAGQVILRGLIDRGGGILANVQPQQHGATSLGAAALGLLHVAQKGVQPFVVESQPVDQCMGFGQTEQARLWVARLGFGCDRAHLDKAKAHGSQSVDAASILVQTGGKTNSVGEAEPRQLNRVGDKGLCIKPLKGRALKAGE